MENALPPRQLTKREAAIIRWLLSRTFDGVEALRVQVACARVAQQWGPNDPSIDLVVDEDVVAADLADGPTPGVAWAYDASGEPIATVLLWIEGGYLSALEIGTVTDDQTSELPPAISLRWGR